MKLTNTLFVLLAKMMEEQESTSQEVQGLRLINPISKNLCFCNVTVNSLQCLSGMRALLQSSNNHHILRAFQKLLNSRLSLKSAKDLKSLVGQYHPRFRTDQQQCPSEFLECLLEVCEPIRKLFELKIQKTWLCRKCSTETQSVDIVTSLALTDLDKEKSSERLVMKNRRKTSIVFKECHNSHCHNVRD